MLTSDERTAGLAGAGPASDPATARRIAELEAALAEAKQREEAIHLTLIAATKTKEEMVGAAQRQLDEAAAKANEQAEQIVAEAQIEAFKLVTDAREASERALVEAEAEAQRLRSDAEATLANAKREAMTLIADVKEERARLISQREEGLARMRQEFEADHSDLIENLRMLRMVTGDMEERFRAIAHGGWSQLAELVTALDMQMERHGIEPRPVETHRPDPMPTMAAEEESERSGSEGDRPVRGSFYTRRSANLPRIGSDAATGVLSAVTAMRSKVVAAGDDGPDDEDRHAASA